MNKGRDWNLKCSHGKWQLVKEIMEGENAKRKLCEIYALLSVQKPFSYKNFPSNRADPQCWFRKRWPIKRLMVEIAFLFLAVNIVLH